MTRYETLINKANNCRVLAMKMESKWARDYWIGVANKLENMATDLPLLVLEK